MIKPTIFFAIWKPRWNAWKRSMSDNAGSSCDYLRSSTAINAGRKREGGPLSERPT
ncbi:hypothetical protein DM50_2917 [Burkholderia mallei]|nr:hypothetical protein DM50_2917 [Burkholderia mallei]